MPHSPLLSGLGGVSAPPPSSTPSGSVAHEVMVPRGEHCLLGYPETIHSTLCHGCIFHHSESWWCWTSRQGEVHPPGKRRDAPTSQMLGNRFDSSAAAPLPTLVFEAHHSLRRTCDQPQYGQGEGTLGWPVQGAMKRPTCSGRG